MAFVAYRPVAAARGFAWVAAFLFALAYVPGNANAQSTKSLDVASSGRGFTINEVLARRDSGRPNAASQTAKQVAAAAKPETADDASRDVMPGVRSTGIGPEPFGLYAMRAPDGQLWTKWRAMEKEIAEEMKAVEACVADPKTCADGVKRYLLIVEETRKWPGRARFETANRLLNRAIRYTADDKQHGVADRWTAPLASLAAERGDCEDYAIAKYMVLRATGVAESDMRLVLVRDTQARVDHAVLAVRFDGRWIILDNRRSITIETADLQHYMPLFALDRDGVKLFAAQVAARDATPANDAANDWGGADDAASGFSTWQLRGSDYASWTLRGTDAEPAATAE